VTVVLDDGDTVSATVEDSIGASPKPGRRAPARRGPIVRWRAARARHPSRTWILTGVGLVVAVFLAILLDAYWQTYRVYADAKAVSSSLGEAKDQLEAGTIPSGELFDRAVAAGESATGRLEHPDFAYRWVSSLPGLGRPMATVRWGAVAAGQDARAAGELRDLIRDTLGASSLRDGKVSGSPPIYRGGAVDLALVRSLTPRLDAIRAQLRAAEVSVAKIPPLGLPYVDGKIHHSKTKAIADSDKVIALLGKAIAGTKLLPVFLGAEGPRYYLLAIQNNVDQRATGGSVLGYAIVRIQDGQMKLLEGGGIKPLDLSRTGPRFPLDPSVEWYINYFDVPFRIKNGANYSPDFPIVGPAWAKFVENARGIHVDGAIALDPFVIAAALTGEGTMKVPSYPGVVDASNLVEVTEYKQYFLSKEAQKALPTQMVEGAFKVLEHPSNLMDMVRGLGDSVAGRHIQVWARDPRQESLLHQLGWDGSMYAGPGDSAFLAYNKRIAGKQDYWMRENVRYTVNVHADDSIDSTYQVTATSEIPPDQPGRVVPHRDPYGVNALALGLYVPKRARVQSITPSDANVEPPFYGGVALGFSQHVEGPHRVLLETITPYPGHPKTLTYRYHVPGVVQTTPQGKVYQLTLQSQPLYHPTTVTVTVHLPQGAEVSRAPGWTVTGTTATMRLTLTSDVHPRILFTLPG
jgi:Protein of unknown function (DUF4012)